MILGEDADVYGFETADSEDESAKAHENDSETQEAESDEESKEDCEEDDDSEEDWEPKKTKKTKKAKKTKEKTNTTEEWNAPYQILWDTPPTFNRTDLEMVCILATRMRAWAVRSSVCACVRVCSGAECGPLLTDMHATMTPQGEPDKIAHFVYDSIDTLRNNMQDMLGQAPNPIFDESRRSCCLHAQYRFIYC